MNTELRHLWELSSPPLTVIGATVIHPPIFCPRMRCQISNFVVFPTAVLKASSASYPRCRRRSSLPYLIIFALSPVRNSVPSHRSATRCLVTTNNAVQLRWAVCVGSGISIPAYLIGNPVIFRPSMASIPLRKISVGNSSWSTVSAGWKYSLRP